MSVDWGFVSDLAVYVQSRDDLLPQQRQVILHSTILDLPDGMLYLRLLADLWASWEEHPDFEWYYKQVEFDPFNPLCTAVYEHERGWLDETESLMLSTVRELLRQKNVEWGEKSLGWFAGLKPIEDWIGLEGSLITSRVGYISFSLKGSGRAYRARMVLKNMLPKSLRKWVQHARSCNARPKYRFLPEDLKSEYRGQDHVKLRRTPSMQPDWYRYATKGQLWVRAMPAEDRELMQQYIDPMDFWRCATGEVHPSDVAQYVVHQPDLFDSTEIYESSREAGEVDEPESSPLPHVPSSGMGNKDDIAADQLSFL